ncbi:MAG: chromosome segregation protein SMC [Acidobacteria bacterium]|nr:MAG: chromosome segregation protein SMC [Acidobacteriota bacterium]
MLKLKKLQILGFKSFCDRTELKFHGDGIASIVGPNGCGKSNVSDAISWVLGEQSARTLRGARMEDVIFAGTRDRKPTGMAEVSLTLIDPDVYDGDASGAPEIDIQDELSAEDWDEATVRSSAAEDAAQAEEEARPGQFIDVEGNIVAEPADDQPTELSATDSESPESPEVEDPEPGNQAPGSTTPDVVLRIRRRKFKMQFRAGEIVVTRRLFRSGESEYLLNGKLCRLRDIQDIFMGTGLGPESYAIIEQGRIGQILSSKPHDRRAIIEEAAGITRFKTKKRLAELRLEQSRQNLSRINDIFDEVTRQMNSLKRQAAKAERYGKLRDEMREKLRIVLASKLTHMTRENAALEEQIQALTDELNTRNASLTEMEMAHTAAVERGYAIDGEIRTVRERLGTIEIESGRISSRRSNNQERCADLTAQTVANQAELERIQIRFEELAAEEVDNRAVLESAATDVELAEQQHRFEQEQVAESGRQLFDLEQQQELRRRSAMEVMSAVGRVRSEILQAEDHLSSLAAQRERIGSETEATTVEAESLGGRRGQVTMEFESITDTVNALSNRISEVRAALEEKRALELECKRHVDGLRGELATAMGKKASIDALLRDHGYSTESVKRLLKANVLEGGLAPAGVLADFLEVDDQYEGVIDDFFRDELNYIVVKSWNAAEEGMRLLKGDADGRATFLVHPNDSQAKFSFAVDENAQRAPASESIVPLTRCIRVLNGFGKSLEVILPKLRDGYITPDSAVARELALENPDAFFLSPSGETFHNVTVTGGKQRTEGPLSLKRELRDISRTVQALEGALRNEELRVQMLAREVAELAALLERLQDERHEAEKDAHSSGVALKQMEAELSRTEQRLHQFRLEMDRIQQQQSGKEEMLAFKREELERHEVNQCELQLELNNAQQALAENRATRDTALQRAAEAKARLAGLEERRRAAATALERINRMVAEVRSRIETLESQIAGAAAEKHEREQENVRLAEVLISLQAERESGELKAAELQRAGDQTRLLATELDASLRTARQELDALRDRRSELSTTLARLQSDMQHLAETCLQELSLTSDVLLADTSIAMVEGEALAQEEELYREMRTKLDNMGPVNMMALEEYKETAQRHEFLEIQRKDLLDSIENTQNTIREIDEFSKQKFDEAFVKINENFQVTFRKLFAGGHGFMKLTDEENSAESGIDIVASPPGKKLQNVLLLSGGEKALTALSLLVGIFQYQPSPFCILDEVDAPLDESNVGRFTELVKEMSDRTQFIVITHHKRTISSSPVLYGVTMQEPGVSKIVSVRFGEEQSKVQMAATA